MVTTTDNPEPTTSRKIYFFRVNAGVAASGKPIPFDPAPILKKIKSLPWIESGRYLKDSEGKYTGLWINQIVRPQKIRFGNIRRSELPQEEKAGKLSSLFISPNSGLADQTHIIFFDDNIVGADFNFYGPRISRLSEYLIKKAPEFFPPFIYFEPLLKQDLLKQLDKLKDIRLFSIKLHSSYAEVLKQADQNLGDAFEAAAKVGQAVEMEIILRPARHSKAFLSDSIVELSKQLVKDGKLRGTGARLIVKGTKEGSTHLEQIDLLNDKLISQKRIVCLNARSRELDPTSAFQAIEEAYHELYPELIKAAAYRS